jgi:hypothetical protein
MESKQIRGLMEAYASIYNTTISESHFKVGDEVEIKSNGMEGEIVKVDPEGEGKYYTVKHEDGKTKKYSPDELKLDKEEEKGEKEEEGASKEKEGEFHDKLDKMVHKTFGKRPEEKKMKEEVELDEARAMSHTGGTPHPLQGDGSRPRGMGGKSFGIEDLPPPSKPKTVKDVKESADLFDIILEHLVAEGYADTNKAALAIMANMSEEWKQSIVEADSMAAFQARREARLARQRKREGRPSGGGDFGHDYGKPRAQADAEREQRMKDFINKKN